jgi:hypothetical protein
VALLLTSLLAAVTVHVPTIKVEPVAVHAGSVVRVHGSVPGCPAPGRVTLISRAFSHAHDFAGLPALYAPLGRHGGYTIVTRIPAKRPPRLYTITGRCGGGNLGVSAHLRVLARMG